MAKESIQLWHRKYHLVGEGMIEIQEIKRAVNHYVNTVLCADDPPDPNDRAYHPADRDLKNHICKAKKALELSKLDQHNFKLKLQEWESSHPDLNLLLSTICHQRQTATL